MCNTYSVLLCSLLFPSFLVWFPLPCILILLLSHNININGSCMSCYLFCYLKLSHLYLILFSSYYIIRSIMIYIMFCSVVLSPGCLSCSAMLRVWHTYLLQHAICNIMFSSCSTPFWSVTAVVSARRDQGVSTRRRLLRPESIYAETLSTPPPTSSRRCRWPRRPWKSRRTMGSRPRSWRLVTKTGRKMIARRGNGIVVVTEAKAERADTFRVLGSSLTKDQTYTTPHHTTYT